MGVLGYSTAWEEGTSFSAWWRRGEVWETFRLDSKPQVYLHIFCVFLNEFLLSKAQVLHWQNRHNDTYFTNRLRRRKEIICVNYLNLRLVYACMLSHFNHVQFFVTLWAVARLSVGFSRQEYRSGLPCPPPGDLPNPGIEPSAVLPGRFFTTSTIWYTLGAQ